MEDDNNTACKILMTKTELRKSLDFVNEERERLQEELEEEKRINEEDLKYIDELEARIEKAVEYIKEHIRIDDEYPDYMEMLIEEKDELLNILNGRSDE